MPGTLPFICLATCPTRPDHAAAWLMAQEAHGVVVENYSEKEVGEFQDALTPVFQHALPGRIGSGEPRMHES